MAKRVPVRSSLRSESWLHSTSSVPARSSADTKRLYTQLQQRRWLSPYSGSRSLDGLASQVLAAAIGSRKLPDSLHQAFATCAHELVACEAELFQLPQLPPDHSIVQAVETRSVIQDRLSFFQNPTPYIDDWTNTLARCLAAIAAAIPSIDTQPATLVVPVPIVNLVDDIPLIVRQIVTDLIRFTRDPRAPCTVPGANLAGRITSNLLAASRTDFDAAQRHPERLRWPGNDRATPQEVITRYLGDTPWASLFDATIPLPIPERARFEGTHIVAKPGHGKTQLLQTMILADVDAPHRPTVVVIDSQQDLIRTLSRLDRFNPARDNRALIINPGDTDFPLRINPFDLNRQRIAKLDQGQREELLAGIVELLSFVFEALSSDLTGRQSLVVRMLCQWMLEIPGATILTMTKLLKDPTPYLQYVDPLPPTAQTFIREHLYSKNDRQYADVCKQLQRRLFELLSIPTFERCLSSPKNALDFKPLLDTGAVILINTAKARLKTAASATFGRIMIAMLLQAILERANDPEHTRRPVFVYIDECAEYFDGNTLENAILQGRKYKAAFAFAHQNIEGQLRAPGLKAALMTTALRFTGEVSFSDAVTLAREMKTSPEFLLGMRKHAAATEFAVHARNITPAAIKVTVPFFVAENAPRMNDAAYDKLLARVRAQIATPLASVFRKSSEPPDDIISTDPEEFADRY